MVDLNHAAVDGIKLSVNAPDDISDVFSLEKSPSIPKSQAENLRGLNYEVKESIEKGAKVMPVKDNLAKRSATIPKEDKRGKKNLLD